VQVRQQVPTTEERVKALEMLNIVKENPNNQPVILLFKNPEQLSKQLTEQFPTLQKVYIEMVEIILTNTLLHQQSYTNEKPEKRYELFKENSPHLLSRISQKHMASHLGITPISFSRMKKRLGN